MNVARCYAEGELEKIPHFGPEPIRLRFYRIVVHA